MRQVLVVSRNFAPTSHVSVERAVKLVKYLRDFGWQPTVLTGAQATAGLGQDPRLLDQVAGVEIIRARAPEFSWFYGGLTKKGDAAMTQRGAPRRGMFHPKAWLVPDSQVLWHPFAVRAAMRRAETVRWDAIVATSFPPTAILIAHTIGSRLGIPYVADFRDSWTMYHHAPHRPAPLAAFERRLEARMIRDAAAVVTVQARFVEHALGRIATADRPPLHVIPNGYDEDDFRGTEPAELPPFSIVHTGQWRRTLEPLWDGLSAAMEARPELLGRLHLWQVGFVEAQALPGLQAPPAGVIVHHVPQVSQREAISYMLGADLLLVDQFQSTVPAKLFQYLRASRPILALIDGGGEIREVLAAASEVTMVPRDDPAGAGALIATLATGPRHPSGKLSDAVAAYSRREIAGRFAAVLDAACVLPRRPSPAPDRG